MSHYDKIYVGHEGDTEFLINNGLCIMTAEQANAELMAMNSAIPISLIWANLDDNEKYMAWDSDLEKHLQHFARVIDMAGRESYEPHTIYNEMGLNWLDGFATNQGTLGSCCMLAHWHAARQNKLVFSKMKGDFQPIDVMPAITYAVARGNGRINWGSGLNLQPMSQWAARIGNFTAADMGRYDIRGTQVTAANKQRFAANSLKYQSVPCYLPNNSFDTFYNIARAGLCCNIGTNSWPSGSIVDSNGMAIGQGVSRGAHAVTVGGHAMEIGGTRYILFTNSHGSRFRQGTRIRQSTFGCYVTNQQWNQMFSIDNRFGRPYINFIEMVTL